MRAESRERVGTVCAELGRDEGALSQALPGPFAVNSSSLSPRLVIAYALRLHCRRAGTSARRSPSFARLLMQAGGGDVLVSRSPVRCTLQCITRGRVSWGGGNRFV